MFALPALDAITACTARLPRFPNASALAAVQTHVPILAVDVQVDGLALVAHESHAKSGPAHIL